jgi:hypothetical protein
MRGLIVRITAERSWVNIWARGRSLCDSSAARSKAESSGTLISGTALIASHLGGGMGRAPDRVGVARRPSSCARLLGEKRAFVPGVSELVPLNRETRKYDESPHARNVTVTTTNLLFVGPGFIRYSLVGHFLSVRLCQLGETADLFQLFATRGTHSVDEAGGVAYLDLGIPERTLVG